MLSLAQLRTFSFIRNFIFRRGHAPSLSEVATGCGIRSKSTAHKHVQALMSAGYLRLIPGRKRGIELVEGLEGEGLSLPLLGRIAAGKTIEAIADQEQLNLADYLLGPGCYALKVEGDSMIGAGILDGDMVIVRQQETADDNRIVVALVDETEAIIKRLRHLPDGRIALIPGNPDLSPMHYEADRVRIQGVVVGQLRRYEQ